MIRNQYQNANEFFRQTVKSTIENPQYICSPRGMKIYENIAFNAEILDPKDRIIHDRLRKFDIVYALGEFCWYMRSSDKLDDISYYASKYSNFSDDGETLYGAYGPRLIADGMLQSVIDKLKQDHDSRQGLALIWRKEDATAITKDFPCTVYLHFMIRNEKLICIANMRSNDLWLGAPNDIFCFTMIQEYVANKLGIDMGSYYHNAGSLHLYQYTIDKIIQNNWIENPELLKNDPMTQMFYRENNIDCLLRKELEIRTMEQGTKRDEDFVRDIIDYMSFLVLDCYNPITDLIYVLRYGKFRKLFKKSNPDLYNSNLEMFISHITEPSIKKCIQIYEGII